MDVSQEYDPTGFRLQSNQVKYGLMCFAWQITDLRVRNSFPNFGGLWTVGHKTRIQALAMFEKEKKQIPNRT